jgi:ribosomal protein L4
VLLESCLGDHLAFVERTKRLIRHVIEAKIAAELQPNRSIEERCEVEPSWSCSQKWQDHERASETNHKPAFQ